MTTGPDSPLPPAGSAATGSDTSPSDTDARGYLDASSRKCLPGRRDDRPKVSLADWPLGVSEPPLGEQEARGDGRRLHATSGQVGVLADRLASHREQAALRSARALAAERDDEAYADALAVVDLDRAIALLDALPRDDALARAEVTRARRGPA